MKVFFGAAIQGHKEWGERRDTYAVILKSLKDMGAHVCTEHTTGNDLNEILALQEKAIGPSPKTEPERTIFVRNKMIEFVESDVDACLFEVSTPSLGTGIEFAHAYLRPRLGLQKVPVLALYQQGYWPNKLSTMIRGLRSPEFDHVIVQEYQDRNQLVEIVETFINSHVKRD